MTSARHLSAVEQRKYDKIAKEQRLDKLMDRLDKFLDTMIVSEALQPASVEIVNPPGMDEVLTEMVESGLVQPVHMRKLIESIRPILEENAKLKSRL